MKLFCLAVAEHGSSTNPSKLLAVEHELSSFGYFQRGSVQEFMSFFAKTAAERTNPGVRQQIEQEQYIGSVYVRSDGLAGVAITDKEYPTRVAFSIINKIIDEFSSQVQRNKWASLNPASTASYYPNLRAHLTHFQTPNESDPILKVQRELDDTKVILHKTMDSLLQRGEKLDDLVAKSDQLSTQSKVFYKTAKKTNSCCYLM